MEAEEEEDSVVTSAADEEAALQPLAMAPAATSLAVPPVRTRRCSARLLSVNVREALHALRQREHKSRVAALVQRRADFYRRQRCCECVSMVIILGVFSAFSLYVVFAYGFYVGQRKPFNLVEEPYEHRLRRPQARSPTDLSCDGGNVPTRPDKKRLSQPSRQRGIYLSSVDLEQRQSPIVKSR
jgi:hypothetical protein